MFLSVKCYGHEYRGMVGEEALVLSLSKHAVAVDGEVTAHEDIVDQRTVLVRYAAEVMEAPFGAIDYSGKLTCVVEVVGIVSVGDMLHHVRFRCGVEVAGHYHRCALAELVDFVEYEAYTLVASHFAHMIQVSVERKQCLASGAILEACPGCHAVARAVPAERTGAVGGLAEPECAAFERFEA